MNMMKYLIVGFLSLAIGVAFGLEYAYNLNPIQFKDADLTYLRDDLQQDYLRMTIDSFRVNGDQDLALARYRALGTRAPVVFNEVGQNTGNVDPGAILAFQQVLSQNNAFEPSAVETPTTPAASGEGDGLFSIAIIVGAL